MNIAVITGASAGIGREFLLALDQDARYDELWVIARRAERLEALGAECRAPVRPIALDLTCAESIAAYDALLREYKPNVRVLVNCSGYGKFGDSGDIPLDDALGMIDLNCKAMVAMTQTTLPYMCAGARIVQLGSVSAFQPLPYFNVYAATKSFVLQYARALNMELRVRGIRVLAVCPHWVRTPFFDRAKVTSDTAVRHYYPIYEAHDVVQTAIRHMKRGRRDVSVHGALAKAQVALVRLLPHRLVMRAWMAWQKH